MNTLTWFLARRYLLKSAYENNIGTMMIISFLGILVGTCALALVTAITDGFRVAIYEKMQGVHAQIIVKSHNEQLNADAFKEVVYKEFPDIVGITPTATQHGIIHLANDASEISAIALIKAIDPKTENLVSTLQEKIIPQPNSVQPLQNSLEKILVSDHVLIGVSLAEQLDLSINDSFQIMVPSEKQTSAKRIIFETKTVKIGGLFKTGIDEFDSSVIICAFDFFTTLFPDVGVEQIHIRLKPGADEQTIIQQLKDRTELDVRSWKDLYPALVSALTLEQYVSFFIISLIALVASLNMISLLFMQITQKKTDIALLRVLGASNRSIMSIFIFMGMLITTMASISGLLIASLICWLLDQFPFIQLPDAYLVTRLPAHMTWSIAFTVFFVVTILGLLATIIPVRSIRNFNIAQVLRFEG